MLDRDIREHLRQTYLTQYDDGESRVIEEMALSSHAARIDIGVINGQLVGYEIKSERDNLDRLPGQLEVYCKIFDRLSLICGPKHQSKLLYLLPDYCGLYVIAKDEDGKIHFDCVRTPGPNPDRQGEMIASLLWHSELMDLLREHGAQKIARLRVWELWERAADHFQLDELAGHVRRILKARTNWRVGSRPDPLRLQPSPELATRLFQASVTPPGSTHRVVGRRL